MANGQTTVLRNTGRGFVESLGQIVQRRSLLGALVSREVRARYAGTVLGLLWVVIQPALLVAFYVFIFTVVFQMRTGQDIAGRATGSGGKFAYAMFILGGLVPWLAFADGLRRAAGSIAQNKSIITKVVFPVELLPIAGVVSAQVALVATTLIVVVMAGATGTLSLQIGWLPLLAAVLMLLSLGLGYILAVFSTFFKDVSNLVPFALNLWMYASPILYPISALPPAYRKYMMLNPLMGVIDGYRAVLIRGEAPSLVPLVYSAAMGVLSFLVGFWMFRRAQRLFVEVL